MDLWEFNGNLMGNVWELYGMNIEHSTKNMPLKKKKWIQLVVIHNSLGGHVCIYICMCVCNQQKLSYLSHLPKIHGCSVLQNQRESGGH